jgi:hypothetical protein
MTSSVEYATYIIDLSMAMLEHRIGLTDAQAQRLQMIHGRAVDFLTEYIQHESSGLLELLDYLGKDAVSPLRIIIGCADMILNGQCGIVQEAYAEAIEEIRECSYCIQNDIEDMYENLQNLMSDLGMFEE